jgi:predicted phage terminase large subunit-like protein
LSLKTARKVQASPEEQAAYAALIERKQQALIQLTKVEDPTPGHLARRLDPMTIQTPALDILDAELVLIRDSIEVMFARRRRFVELTNDGLSLEEAIQRAANEIESRGNDRLIVSAPPQEGKSSRITRHGVLWLLRQFPWLRVGIVSYDGDVAGQFSWQIRGDIDLFDGTEGSIDLGLRLVIGQKAMSRWVLQSGGGVYAIGIGGGLTSRPLDLLLIDDPVKDMRAADSLLMSSQAYEWYQTVARPRLAPWAPVIQLATAWHEADLRGRLIAKQAEDQAIGAEYFDRWRVVNIPAQADHDPSAGQTDILNREPGEFMVSARGRTREQWIATKAATEPRFWSALYQGKPTPDDGDVWLKMWWRRYDAPLWSRMEEGGYQVDGYVLTQSWDLAFIDKDTSDFVVGQVWAKKGADSYLVYQVWARLNFPATLEAFRRVTRLFPQAKRKLVEGKANGDALIDSLKHEIPGIVRINPIQSKKARARAVSTFIEAGNVHLPTSRVATMQPEIAWDVEAFLHEATAFGGGAGHDDQVDATSQYLEEAYLHHSEARMSFPTGLIPRATMRQRGTRLPPRPTAGLPPHQRRLTERQLSRPGG